MKHLLLPVAALWLLSGCASTSSGPKLLPPENIWGALLAGPSSQKLVPAEREVLSVLITKMNEVAMEKFRRLPYRPLSQTNLQIEVSFDGTSGYKLKHADASLPPLATTLALESLNEGSKAMPPSEAWSSLAPKIIIARFIFP